MLEEVNALKLEVQGLREQAAAATAKHPALPQEPEPQPPRSPGMPELPMFASASGSDRCEE
jgi:hypothetical protein